MPAAWDAIAGDYRSGDGWIRLHTNAPHHRAAALSVLGCAGDRAQVAQAVETWSAEELESAIVAAGGCAAAMRSIEAWAQHPQGKAVAAEPLIAFAPIDAVPNSTSWRPCDSRPLTGLKILDLTRVLAGPVATRFLAGYGANVLRVDPPDWDEAGVVPEMTLGKRCVRLDLHQSADRASFERLLSEADVLVHGYRPGAFDGLGYGEAERRAIKPDLIDVSLDAYGWSGPWKGRRGFDSLVQMSVGIAGAGMKWKHADRPTPLPVQALDHATGYMMAAAVIRALIMRQKGERVATARLSLARAAKLLVDMQEEGEESEWAERTETDLSPWVEQTAWGPARRLFPPAKIADAPMAWDRAASHLGSAEPVWSA
jgi:crotonobetainyl-CoA:carnitine CoA-transferase CaiB-like acyl-CoA transferase